MARRCFCVRPETRPSTAPRCAASPRRAPPPRGRVLKPGFGVRARQGATGVPADGAAGEAGPLAPAPYTLVCTAPSSLDTGLRRSSRSPRGSGASMAAGRAPGAAPLHPSGARRISPGVYGGSASSTQVPFVSRWAWLGRREPGAEQSEALESIRDKSSSTRKRAGPPTAVRPQNRSEPSRSIFVG